MGGGRGRYCHFVGLKGGRIEIDQYSIGFAKSKANLLTPSYLSRRCFAPFMPHSHHEGIWYKLREKAAIWEQKK